MQGAQIFMGVRLSNLICFAGASCLTAAGGADEVADGEVRKHEEGCCREIELEQVLAPEGSVVGLRMLEG
jgi:hypothetical protein